jgi:hypothetical protein
MLRREKTETDGVYEGTNDMTDHMYLRRRVTALGNRWHSLWRWLEACACGCGSVAAPGIEFLIILRVGGVA